MIDVMRRPGRHLVALLASCVVVVGSTVGGAVALVGPAATVSASRVAADRGCPASSPLALTPVIAGPPVEAVPVGSAEEPTSLALLPGRTDGLLGERPGRVVAVVDGMITGEVVLDLSEDTTHEGDGGLLGLAYDLDGAWLYVYRATAARDDVVTAYPLDGDGRPRADAGREILRVDHPPSPQHHGGAFLVGADGMLYVGLGDGGGHGDPHENAQDPTSLLGKVLRIDPTPTGRRPYAVPADNPYVGRPGWRPEIWALGVRNPFRMSQDPATGDLWLGDVGQTCWEELNRLGAGDAGANLGWDRREGGADFEGGDVDGVELTPVHVRPHSAGWCAVVAGYVPRSSPVPTLDGWLLHTDYCAGRILALQADPTAAGAALELRDLGIEVANPIAIVPGPTGRPWVLTLGGKVFELRT